MLLAIGFCLIVLAGALYVLAVLAPKRDMTLRSKEKALRLVTPADVRAARECADWKGELYDSIPDYSADPLTATGLSAPTGGGASSSLTAAGLDREKPPDARGEALPPCLPPERRSGYEFGEFDHAETIDYHSTRVATPSESSTPLAAGEVRSSSQSAMDEAPAVNGQSGGEP